jgi:hypothetical protein
VVFGVNVNGGDWVKVCGLDGPIPSGSITVVVGPGEDVPSGPDVVV